MINAELSPKSVGVVFPEGGKRGRLLPQLHSHHQNDFCIKMGSDESRFSVLLIVRDRVIRRCPQTTTFKERE